MNEEQLLHIVNTIVHPQLSTAHTDLRAKGYSTQLSLDIMGQLTLHGNVILAPVGQTLFILPPQDNGEITILVDVSSDTIQITTAGHYGAHIVQWNDDAPESIGTIIRGIVDGMPDNQEA